MTLPSVTPNQRLALDIVGLVLAFGSLPFHAPAVWLSMLGTAIVLFALSSLLPRKQQQHWPRKPDLFDEDA